MSGRFILHPGQVEAVIRDERDRRRRIRLDQVRSRSRQNAAMIVERVAASRRRQLDLLMAKLEEEWKIEKRNRLDELGVEYSECLRHVGEGHRSVVKESQAKESDGQQLQENREEAALTRGREALAKLSAERATLHRRLLERHSSRELIRRVEDERAKHVASLPRPPTSLPHVTESSNVLPVIVATSKDEKRDAREAARLEEAMLKSDAVDRSIRATAQLELEKDRFQKAHVKMELQREYNHIMDELAKIAEIEKSSDEGVDFYNSDAKAKLMAKREAVVEELFDKISIVPLVPSTDSSEARESSSDDEDSCVVHHVLLSDYSSISSSNNDQMASTVASSRKSNEAPTSDRSTVSSSSVDPKLSLWIDDDETILGSHAAAYVSNVDIDLSSFPFDEESLSATKWPPSTLDSNGNDSSSSSSSSKALATSTTSDDVEEHDVAMLIDRPVFHNVQVKRYALSPIKGSVEAPDRTGHHLPLPREDVPDKNDVLRRLLAVAVQKRRNTSQDQTKTGRSPIGLAYGLADLRESFLKAQTNLKAELDRKGRKVNLVFGTNGRRPQSQHALSTIVEVDSPDHSYGRNVCDETGITSEPDLTLVSGAGMGSDSSRSSSPLLSFKRHSISSNSSSSSSGSRSWLNGFHPWTMTSSATSTTLPSLSLSAGGLFRQKSICLSHFFDTGTSVTSCPMCQSSIEDSDEARVLLASPQQLLQTSTSSCSDSLYSFLKHEMSADNADSSYSNALD